MNEKINKAVQELVDLLRTESDSNATSFKLFVNSDQHLVETGNACPRALRQSCTSMKNLRGEWIGEVGE